jgi:hypothetical protein
MGLKKKRESVPPLPRQKSELTHKSVRLVAYRKKYWSINLVLTQTIQKYENICF